MEYFQPRILTLPEKAAMLGVHFLQEMQSDEHALIASIHLKNAFAQIVPARFLIKLRFSCNQNPGGSYRKPLCLLVKNIPGLEEFC